MKFLKKALALTVSCLLLCAPAAFAQTQEYYTDDFNQFTQDTGLPWSGYPVTPGSDVFVKFSGSGGNILAAGGRDGKAVLRLETKLDGNNAALQTKDLTTGAGDEVMFTVDFCIEGWGSNPEKLVAGKRLTMGARADFSGSLFNIGYQENGFRGAGVYFEFNGAEQAPCETGKWYSLTVLQTATQRMGLICDEKGELVVENSIASNLKAQENVRGIFIPAFKPVDAVTEGASILFDNAAFYRYNTADNAPSCVSSTVENEAEDVPRNQSLTFTFDQKISGEALLLADGAAVPGALVSRSGFNSLSVSYEGLLDKHTVYTVSFVNVENTGGVACDTANLSFTTEDLHPWKDIVINSVGAGNGGKAQVSFQLADSLGYEEFSGAIMAAVYKEGQMTAVDMAALDGIATTEAVTVDFQLGGLPGTGETLTLILLDTDAGPIPLASGSWTE